MKILKYFYGSIAITVLGVIIGIYLFPDNIAATIYTILLLAVLEVSLSFDNAVINAKILNGMSKFWQKMFIVVGLPVAVFGMRLVFPILLVSSTSEFSFLEVVKLATNNPLLYQEILEQSMPLICGFGGAFLLMVFLNFFLSENNEHKWIAIIENNILVRKIKAYDGGYIVFAIIIGFLLVLYTPAQSQGKVALAFLLGVITHEVLGILTSIFNKPQLNTTEIAKNGLMGFIYLEIIDASFSFDGVIGAFAITTNIIIIMIGLGIGAMFVRSLTILFVEKETLSKYIYIEHGAHYAIGFLAIVLILKIFMHIPEWFSGSIGVLILALAFLHSVMKNKKLKQ